MTVDFGGRPDAANRVAIDANNNTVVGDSSGGTVFEMALVRLTAANGSPDITSGDVAVVRLNRTGQ